MDQTQNPGVAFLVACLSDQPIMTLHSLVLYAFLNQPRNYIYMHDWCFGYLCQKEGQYPFS